jgi:hypothetical protein
MGTHLLAHRVVQVHCAVAVSRSDVIRTEHSGESIDVERREEFVDTFHRQVPLRHELESRDLLVEVSRQVK